MFNLDDMQGFKAWLHKVGAEVLTPTNEYELLRFKTANTVSIIYTGKKGITLTGEAKQAYDKYKAGKGWRPTDRKRQSLRAKKIELATRDGKRCFIHGERMTYDKLTIEHLFSFGQGGTNNLNNLCLACGDCQKLLGNRPVTAKIEIMMRERKRYLDRLNATVQLELQAANENFLHKLVRHMVWSKHV